MSAPSVLTNDRSLYATDFVFTQKRRGGEKTSEKPVMIESQTKLGTHSQYQEDPDKVEAHANPQKVETASLAPDADTLVMTGAVTVSNCSLAPHACDNPVWRQKIEAIMSAFADAGGYQILGRAYAYNIAAGRWAWKNRMLAHQFNVTVTVDEETYVFDAFDYPLDTTETEDTRVHAIGDQIGASLGKDGRLLRLRIWGGLEMGENSPVFPSQEFVEGNDDSQPGRILYGLRYLGAERCAAFHEQKINNAIRTIDTWHEGVTKDGITSVRAGRPLPVNPYAQARAEHQVVRRDGPSRNFYEILRKRLNTMAADIAKHGVENDPEALFVAANFVRGGVFGYGKSEKNKAKGQPKAKKADQATTAGKEAA